MSTIDDKWALHASDISYRHGNTFVLEADLSFPVGVTVLLGENGSGKSTLLRVLATAVPPRSGVLSYMGRSVSGATNKAWFRSRVGWLPQQFGYNPRVQTLDHLMYIGWLKGVPADRLKTSALEGLETVGLSGSARTQLRRLSGGMLRRVGIAQTLMSRPDVLLLDEPTAGLDPTQRRRMYHLLSSIDDGRRVVLISTHLMEDVSALANHVSIIRKGNCSSPAQIEELRNTARQKGVSLEALLVSKS